MRLFLVAAVLALLIGVSPGSSWADGGVQLAQNPSHVCFNDCISANGAEVKGACARRCGLAGGMGGAKRDCGQEYKTCKKSCNKKDKTCKKVCRQLRKSCA